MKRFYFFLSLFCLLCIGVSAQGFTPRQDVAYKIKTAGRGFWMSRSDGFIGVTDDETEASLYAFIQHDSRYYIYSVDKKKYLCKDVHPVELKNIDLSEIQDVTFHNTDNSDCPVYFTNSDGLYYNQPGGVNRLCIDGWSRLDDGNQFALLTADYFEADARNEALKILTNPRVDIVYNIVQNEKVVDTKKMQGVVGFSFPTIDDYASYGDLLNEKLVYPEGMVESAGTYNVTYTGDAADLFTHKLRFEINSDGNTASVTGYMSDLPAEATIPSSISIDGTVYKVTSIGNSAFSGCSGLTSITIPESVTAIDLDAFEGCSGLTSITIPESVTSIGYGAFSGCSSLTSITIPEGVTSIDGWAFSGCSGLTSITIPEGVTAIGSWAFSGCSGLTEIKMLRLTPLEVLNAICDDVIYATCNLIVPQGCMMAYQNAKPWKNFVHISDGTQQTVNVTEDGIIYRVNSGDHTAYVISHTSDLPENVTILSTVSIGGEEYKVTSIGEMAFKGCSGLTSIMIPESVTAIGESVFEDCRGLSEIKMLRLMPQGISDNTFSSDVYKTCNLFVPQGSQMAYRNAEGWKNFQNIREFEYVILDENSTIAPVASGESAYVKVNRTLKANQWSTICLPFAMSEKQLKAAFGDDVKLAEFQGSWEATFENGGDEFAKGIQINFASATELNANRPYIIKTSKDIASFNVNGVTVQPEEVCQQFGTAADGNQAEFCGTYVANTAIPNKALFLSQDKFWYSVGNTQTKAFRCYLNLQYTLDLNQSESEQRAVVFNIDDTATPIEHVAIEGLTNGKVYTLSGVCVGTERNLNKLPKGIYLVNGKKVFNN